MEAISPGTGHADSAADRLPVYPADSARSQEGVAGLAAVGGALVTAIVVQRWNEANRTWLQRWIGAPPYRQTREEVTVRAGALLGGTLAYLLVTGATQGLRRLQDRNGQREIARSICRILRVAATAPDGSMPEEASFIVESALISMGVGARTRKRLLAEPRPASVSDLGACPLPEPLLSAVAVIAFAAMAEATSPQDAVRQMPALLRRMGLARPAGGYEGRGAPGGIHRHVPGSFRSVSAVANRSTAASLPGPPSGRHDDGGRRGDQRAQYERATPPGHPPGNGHPPQARYPCHGQLRHTTSPGRIHRDPSGRPLA